MKHMFQKEFMLEVILELEKASISIRKLAMKIDSSPATVLRKLNDLKKMNILGCIEYGRNRSYFLKDSLKAKNYIMMSQFYNLNKFIYNNPHLKSVILEIKSICNDLCVVIFGSYAQGLQKKDSDVDLFIQTKDTNVKKKIQLINFKLNVKIGDFDKNSFLGKEILKNRVIINGVEKFYELIK